MAAQQAQMQAALQAARDEEQRRRLALEHEAQRQAMLAKAEQEAAERRAAEAAAQKAAQDAKAKRQAEAARLKAEREAAMRAGREAQQQAAQLAALVEQERLQKEALAAELEALKLAKEGGSGGGGGGGGGGGLALEEYDLSASELTPFPTATSETDLFEKGVYAWTASALDDRMSDEQIIEALKKRLKYVHSTAAQALAACVKQSQLANTPEAFAGYGVHPPCMVAFTAQLLYNLSEARAATLLSNVSGGPPIVPVMRFLELFGMTVPATAAPSCRSCSRRATWPS